MLKIQLCITGINCILKYIQIQNTDLKMLIIFHNTAFDLKRLKKSYQPQSFEC